MNNKYCVWSMAALLTLMLVACGEGAREPHGHGHDDAHGAVENVQKGPHNGRLLKDGDLTVELALVESGAAPAYRAWVTDGGLSVPPKAVTLTVTLTRLDGEKDQFEFLADEDFLRGDGVVTEPHSFDVSVVAVYQGKNYRWTYESHEGRVTIAADSVEAAGIVVEHAGPRVIHDTLPLYGRLVINPDAVREVSARYRGVVMSVPKTVGDTVKASETLARVEANDSLQAYSVTAPIAGVITARMTNPGELAGNAPLFIVSDLTQVWAELSVFPRDQARLQLGQTVRLSTVNSGRRVEGRITRIAPAGTGPEQALKIWASFDAGHGGWTPGLFVNADVVVGGAEVPLAVRTAGLQAFRNSTVVFTQVGETYEVRMLELGRSDGEFVEVLGGLKPGVPYVSENSFLIKADIEKSGASHDH